MHVTMQYSQGVMDLPWTALNRLYGGSLEFSVYPVPKSMMNWACVEYILGGVY